MINPNDVDWCELIRECKKGGDVVAMPYKEPDGRARYAIIVCPAKLAADFMEVVAGHPENLQKKGPDVLPTRNRN